MFVTHWRWLPVFWCGVALGFLGYGFLLAFPEIGVTLTWMFSIADLAGWWLIGVQRDPFR